MRFIRPKDLDKNALILDVRDESEYAKESLAYPHFFEPLKHLQPEIFIKNHHLDGSQTINIICASGGRSSQAAQMFEQSGYNNVAVVIGGLIEADYEGLPIVRN